VAGRIEDAIVRYTACSCIYQLVKKPLVHHNYPDHKSLLIKLLEYSGKTATSGKRGILQNYLHLSKKMNERHILPDYLTINSDCDLCYI